MSSTEVKEEVERAIEIIYTKQDSEIMWTIPRRKRNRKMVYSGRHIGDSDGILCEILAVLDQQDQNWILCFSFLTPPTSSSCQYQLL